MSPFINGRIYPETESSALLRRIFRILIDPSSITSATAHDLVDLDVLRQYLRSVPGEPCRLALFAPVIPGGAFEAQYDFIRSFGGEILSFRPVDLPEVLDTFAAAKNGRESLVALTSIALAHDADVLITEVSPADGFDPQAIGRTLGLSFESWITAKRSCEIFAVGHDIPWSFKSPAWWTPLSTFYAIAEPDLALMRLYEAVSKAKLDPHVVELVRSFAFNRHAGLCYSRDKLLFFVQQRRAAKRHKLQRQDFSFEAGYFLNHYYLLLWAGLDQLCWIINGIYSLGLKDKDFRKVGFFNATFLRLLHEKAPEIETAFKEDETVKWVKILRSARHFIAHRGFAMPAQMFIKPDREPTDEELEAEVEQSEEWRELKSIMPPALLSMSRATLKEKAMLRRCKEVAEAVMKLEIDGDTAMIFPLLNVEWDFNHFFQFAHRVADIATEKLTR